MAFKLSKLSESRLQGVKPQLASVVRRALEISQVDFMVTEGLRTIARQRELYAQGRTKPGPKVTWTLHSKHLEGNAVDLAPVIGGAVDWSNTKNFDAIAKAMMQASRELGVPIRWGADWDMDGIPREKGESDSPHFELA